jgi:undecaprenyl-diphosphatase
VAAVRGPLSRPLGFIAARLRPGAALGLSLTIGLVVIGLTGWVFGAVTQDVIANEAARIDRPVYRFFIHHRVPTLTGAMRAVTWLGSVWVVVGLVVALGLVWLWRRRTWRPLVLGLGAWVSAAILTNTIKALIDRPRPPAAHWIGAASGASFPSGHTSNAVAVYGVIAALIAASSTSWSRRVAAWAGALIVWTAVGVTRMYLGVHWLTDVLGGFALGGLWLFSLLTAVHAVDAVTKQRAAQRSDPATPSPDLKADTIPR